MADDLSLLFRLKADNAQAKAAIAETKLAATSLKSHFAGELQNMNAVTQGVFGDLTKHLNLFVGERIPLLGGAFLKVTENVRDMGKEVENAGGGLAAFGGAAGVAALAVTAAAAATVGLGVALFEIVEKSSKAGLELEHIIEKTGLGAKTITALKFAAEESGQSIEGFDVGMKLFANTVAKAAEGSDQAGQALKRLGITPKEALSDLDGALAKVFKKIYDAPSGVEKMSLAADAFGRRMGANLIPLIESFHGDLGALIKRAEELGVTLDEKGVQSLADFERSMNTLKAQAMGLERTFATELAPTLLGFLQDLSKFLAQNKQAFIEWGNIAADVIRGVRAVADNEFVGIIASLGKLVFQLTALGQILVSLRGIGQYMDAGETDPRFKTGTYDPKTGAPDRLKGVLELGLDKTDTSGGGGRAARIEKLSAGQKLLNSLTDEYNKLLAKENELTQVDITTQELQKKEFANLDIALRNRIIGEAELVDIEKESAKQKKESIKAIKEAADASVSAAKEIAEAAIEQNNKRIALEDKISDAIQKQRDTLSELQGFEKTHVQTVEEYIIQAVKEAEAVGGVTAAMRTYFALLIQIAAKEDEIVAKRKAEEAAAGIGEAGANVFGAAQKRAGQLSIKNTASAIEQLHEGLKDKFSGSQLKGIQAGVEALSGAFEGLGQAVGQVVQAWVLYGNSGTSVRKVTAEILASVAQQAAIKAVFELAEGFAALAMAFFGIPNAGPSASAHFIAAGIYGSIAGIAAVAGRGVAGGAFAQGGAATSGGSSGGGSSTSAGGSASSSSPITLGSQRQPVIHLVVEHKASPAFQSVVVAAYVKDHENGGLTRQVNVKEIQRQS